MEEDKRCCVIETCRYRHCWNRLVPLPKDRRVAASWIKACWPYGIVLDEDSPFLLCIEHFSPTSTFELLNGQFPTPDQFQSCSLRSSTTIDCTDQIIWYLTKISADLSEQMISRTSSLLLYMDTDELSDVQKRCAHYLDPPEPALTDIDNLMGAEDLYGGQNEGVKAEPWPLTAEMDGCYGGMAGGAGMYVTEDGRTYYPADPRVYPQHQMAAALGYGELAAMQSHQHHHHQQQHPFQMMQHPPPAHLAAILHYDPDAVLKAVCKHGYFKDACIKCSEDGSGMRRQQGHMNCCRPLTGPKASIPFLEPAFREKIHNPFEGCTSLPALKPGAVRTREEGLETQLEASYRGILTKYYSNKWSRKTNGLKVARVYNVSKIECCVCGMFVPDNISLTGHFCAHLEDVYAASEEELHVKLLDPNSTVIMSPDPFAAALNRTCAYCPNQPTFETPFDYIFHLDIAHMHEIKQYRCRICEQTHRNLLELACHLNLCHCGTELPYRCETCGYRTSFYADLLFHLVRFHKGEDIFYCPFCLQAIQLKPIYGQQQYKGSLRSKSGGGGGGGTAAENSESILYLDCDAAYEHITLHFDRNEGPNKQNPSRYKYCRKCVLHLKAIKDHMKGDHLNIVAGAKASYMSSTDDEEYCMEQGIIGGAYAAAADQITSAGSRKQGKQRRKADRRKKTTTSSPHTPPQKRPMSRPADRSRIEDPGGREIKVEINADDVVIPTVADEAPTASVADVGAAAIAPTTITTTADDDINNQTEDRDSDPAFALSSNSRRKESPAPLRRSRRTKSGRKSSRYADYSEFD